MSRFTGGGRVFFVEEPVVSPDASVRLDVSERGDGIFVVVPVLPEGLLEEEAALAMRALVDDLLSEREIAHYVLWYYTPMALPFTRHLTPGAVVYDCMDELSAFKGAPPRLLERERELLDRADVVFTGGHSLYEAKRHLHPNIHAFPSSIDYDHFARARAGVEDPEDQHAIARPRIGYFGVVDERMDLDLLAAAAAARPDWQFVLVGPVVKIDPEALPKLPNVHHLGPRDYKELPLYLAHWDVAMMPFARNESTRFISPTKTPEYLAAGKPVVSTSIRDVVRPYGESGLVEIADTPEEFLAAVERHLGERDREGWLERVDAFLATTSWDETWSRMAALVDEAIERRAAQRDSIVSAGAARQGANLNWQPNAWK